MNKISKPGGLLQAIIKKIFVVRLIYKLFAMDFSKFYLHTHNNKKNCRCYFPESQLELKFPNLTSKNNIKKFKITKKNLLVNHSYLFSINHLLVYTSIYKKIE